MSKLMRSNKRRQAGRCQCEECNNIFNSKFVPRSNERRSHIKEEIELMELDEYQRDIERCIYCGIEIDDNMDFGKPTEYICDGRYCGSYGIW